MHPKIDPSILNSVGILEVDKCQVIVYYRDENFLHKVQNNTDFEVLGHYPFIKALAICVNYRKIFDFANDIGVNYVTKVATTHTLIHNARDMLGVDRLHTQGINGRGVNVAVIDTGCYPHLDFVLGENRIVKFVDFVNGRELPYDDNGHGSFVAGVLCGSGLVSGAKFTGIAPKSGLIVLKSLKSDGQTQAYKVLEAMQWIYTNCLKYNIRVVCMSFGSTPLGQNDPLSLGANSLWQKGVVVVSAVGNDGPRPSSVKSPGASGKIITVGCADTRKNDISVADFSSRGPIFDFIKPDLIAPGVEITSLSNSENFYTTMSGTSVSAPVVAGICALLIQQNSSLTPNMIKSILLSSARTLPFDVNACGAGLVDAWAASELAKLSRPIQSKTAQK